MDLIVTSPPYFGLRDYGYAGQIGSEGTPGEWLEVLWACTREWVRVLKPEGSLFVNLGDKYSQRVATRPSSHQDGLFPHRPELRKDWKRDRAAGLARMPYENVIADDGRYIPEKSLMGLPWRYAIGCMDQLGLILRAEIVWAKPNGLPESVTDRVRRAHEQVFHFTRQPRYYAAVDEIREPTNYYERPNATRAVPPGTQRRTFADTCNPLGKLPGSVWEIPSAPLQVPARLGVDHFAAFPPALVRPLVLGWSPPGVCTACAQGRRPVVEAEPVKSPKHADGSIMGSRRSNGDVRGWDGLPRFNMARAVTGYACACTDLTIDAGGEVWPSDDRGQPPPTRPAVVLDPFGGTGTTALVAAAYGRTGITVDLSADYCRLARWRVHDPGERARARAMPKPPPVPDGQETLFTIAEGYSPIF